MVQCELNIMQQNELEEEKPATETPPFRPKPRHPFILPTSVSPPPPVRFFGNRIIRPVINSAAGHFVPTKPLMTQDGNPSQNGSKLDAFPSSVTAQPVINRVPSKEAPSTPNQPASQTNSSTTNGGAIRGNQTTTVRIVPANDVAAIAKDHDVPSHLSRGSASTTERQLLERTIKLSHGRHFLKIVQAPGELLTRVSLQPFPLQQQDNETVTSAIQDNGVRQTHSSQPRKAFSFRPHRAPSSQQLSVQEEDTDHEEIAPSELPPAVHEAIRQGFPGREIKRVFKHSQNSRPVLVLGSRSDLFFGTALNYSYDNSPGTALKCGSDLFFWHSPELQL
ncbi:hypothetical protein BIW11_05691 [Tropilaelaps mercedesae]|uniref:Uncharacterized protein n=1 Tax=Tropilaelaps mercedesae TaxID=418985 RepID=A0A1V9Y1D6_9ACAR|nr:hypothetical protein BIW11_05691 [Tropilaelaps mercedesae]